jgi:4'-phosphopantetheinyl transferase
MRLYAQILDRPEVCARHGPRQDLFLGSQDVHAWFAPLDLETPALTRLEKTLSDRELSRSRRFHFQADRRRFIARRAILRLLITRYTGLSSGSIRYVSGSAGKPSLANQTQDNPLMFSVSHSQGTALYGFARSRRIGVDLELLRPMPEMEQLVADFFSTKEKDVFSSLPPAERQDAFFRCWTGKEALLKALGDGLSRGLDQFDLLPGPGGDWRLHSANWDPEAPSRWSLRHLTTLKRYTATVAVENDIPPDPSVMNPGRQELINSICRAGESSNDR